MRQVGGWETEGKRAGGCGGQGRRQAIKAARLGTSLAAFKGVPCRTACKAGSSHLADMARHTSRAARHLCTCTAHVRQCPKPACARHVDTFLKAIDTAAGLPGQGFAAVKLTALGNPDLLERISNSVLTVRGLFRRFDADGERGRRLLQRYGIGRAIWATRCVEGCRPGGQHCKDKMPSLATSAAALPLHGQLIVSAGSASLEKGSNALPPL